MSNDSKDELTLRIGEKLTAARIESGYTQSCAARESFTLKILTTPTSFLSLTLRKPWNAV